MKCPLLFRTPLLSSPCLLCSPSLVTSRSLHLVYHAHWLSPLACGQGAAPSSAFNVSTMLSRSPLSTLQSLYLAYHAHWLSLHACSQCAVPSSALKLCTWLPLAAPTIPPPRLIMLSGFPAWMRSARQRLNIVYLASPRRPNDPSTWPPTRIPHLPSLQAVKAQRQAERRRMELKQQLQTVKEQGGSHSETEAQEQ
eukprot:scaffold216346_cov21-Tisochrysis_lutea.AAC.2